MKPYGHLFSAEGCICSLCRRRGYRKGNGFDAVTRATAHRARQQARQDLREQLP